ncbi:TPA: hypothetical protein GND40_004267 [Salmonella enterica subsp. indica]|uniref:Uncharacterized protein n=2 Tax=Salmonella enterica TaxID=28901 RepID=A0A753A982_SALER|nr:hypothetical protein [Salmonella enterica subsp. indica serovar 45:a:e,n,x]HAE8102529.1 hypothetical protein [Salmonella enterica subsp. indica serovar 45:a:e,n,x]HAF7948246.1 hypothetical protein [Salmonella enterica subsp. indica]
MDKILFTPFIADRSFYDMVYGGVFLARKLPDTNDIKQRMFYCRLLQIHFMALLDKRSRNMAPVSEFETSKADKIIYLNSDNIYHTLSLTAGLINKNTSQGIENELGGAVLDVVCLIYREMRMQMRDYDPAEFQDN